MPESKRIGILLHPVRTYCRRVLRGITTVGAQARWEWMLVSADLRPSLDALSDGFLHGIIGHFSDAQMVEQVKQAGLPAVDVSAARCGSELPCVTTDDLAVGPLAAAHLLSLGLPHFGFYGMRPHYYSLLRVEGFRQSIEAAGLACHVFLDESSSDGVSDHKANTRQLEKWVKGLPKPIGVMASTDARALHLLAICRKLEIAVPSSLAVVGVDNDDIFCEMAHPPLSSIALSTQRIGYEAARMLDHLIEGEPVEKQMLIPPAAVVPRRSSDLPALMDPDVAAAVRYISLHVRDDLQVADVLREIPMSRTSLDQRFRKALGRTPAAEILRAQIEVAKSMLSETAESMPRVALAAGFSNAKQLGSTFRKETGMTATSYRRRFNAPRFDLKPRPR
jgi:LacI family transcriptional regulator